MSEESWHTARLIPTSGINGQEEAERRATSALLAVASVVREFGLSLVKPLGAPSSALETFIEVPFKIEERRVYPDGLIRARRGAKSWTALVEVKTGTSHLERAQLEDYLDVAREQGFDAVLTISNEITHAPGVHPTTVDKRRLKKVALYHYSWSEILTLAVQHRVWRGVADPEQAWILGELIRYLEHPKSGALDFADMSEPWTTVRDSVAHGTLRPSDRGLGEVVLRWEQLLQFASLRMGRQLGAEVEVVRSRKERDDSTLRVTAQTSEIVERGRFTGSLRIPQAINDISVVADIRAGRVHVSVDVDAPAEGRQATKVAWLLRQLKDAPDQLRIDSWSVMSRNSMSELLGAARVNPERLIEDPKKNLRTFRITATSALGTKRGAGRGGFIDSILSAVEGFYEAVVQDLRPWVAKAPQLASGGRSAVEEAGIDLSTPASDLRDETDVLDDESVEDDAIADDGSALVAPIDHQLNARADDVLADLGIESETEVASRGDVSHDRNTGSDEDDTAPLDQPLMTWSSVADRDQEPDGEPPRESDRVAQPEPDPTPDSARDER